jgi:glucans biosynthesis protein
MAGDHPRNTKPMRASRRCGAKTRSGKPCQAPAVAGKARCRMHGGAHGSGAPNGNANARKDGLYTRDALDERKALSALIRQTRKLAQDVE